MSRNLALDYASDLIRVNVVSPGAVDTNISGNSRKLEPTFPSKAASEFDAAAIADAAVSGVPTVQRLIMHLPISACITAGRRRRRHRCTFQGCAECRDRHRRIATQI